MIDASARSPQPEIILSHARARLLIGMVSVGSIWVACIVALVAFSLTSGKAGYLNVVQLSFDVPAISILFLYLFYLCLQITADICGGVIIPLVFKKRSESVSFLISHLGFGFVRHGIINLATLGVLVAGSMLFGRAGLLLASAVNIAALLLFQKSLYQFVGGVRLKRAEEKNTLVSYGLDAGFSGCVVDTIAETALLLPSHVVGPDNDYKIARLNTLMRLQSKFARLSLPIFTNSIGAIFALYYLSYFQSFPVQDVIIYSLCTTVCSFILLLILPVLNRQAVLALDQKLVESGLDFKEFERAIRSEDLRGEDEYSRSNLVQSVFYPIPAPETRIRNVIENKNRNENVVRFWIAFHHIARRTLYTSLGCGGFLSRSVHCNVGRPELWIISPSD